MTTLTDRRLFGVADRLARLLRGVDDPDVFIGTRETLAAEIGRLFDEPVLRRADRPSRLTYRQAVSTCAIPPTTETALDHNAGDAALGVLLDGLRTPMTLAAMPRETLDTSSIGDDLVDLLHQPYLHAYLRGDDAAALAATLADRLTPGEFEVRALPLGGGVALTASFNALRMAVALDAVEAWQVPGKLVLSSEGTNT